MKYKTIPPALLAHIDENYSKASKAETEKLADFADGWARKMVQNIREMEADKFLGREVECAVTGFKGVAVSVIDYLNGCKQYGIRAKVDEKGNRPDVEYIDWQQLKVIGDGVTIPKSDDGPDHHPDAPRG